MRGKYKRKRDMKKRREQLDYCQNNPDKWVALVYGIELLSYQKHFIRSVFADLRERQK